MRIELCGPLGVGKTTLANKLAEALNLIHVKEPVDNHPFLKNFYDAPAAHAFEKNMVFLLDYLHQIKRCGDGGYVFDHSAVVHRSYAELNGISESERPAFRALDGVIAEAGHPDLLINLVCPVDIVLARIKSRGRDFEADVEAAYVTNLINEIQKQVDLVRPYMRVLDIDASTHDFSNPADVLRVIEKMQEKISAVPPAPRPAPGSARPGFGASATGG